MHQPISPSDPGTRSAIHSILTELLNGQLAGINSKLEVWISVRSPYFIRFGKAQTTILQRTVGK